MRSSFSKHITTFSYIRTTSCHPFNWLNLSIPCSHPLLTLNKASLHCVISASLRGQSFCLRSICTSCVSHHVLLFAPCQGAVTCRRFWQILNRVLHHPLLPTGSQNNIHPNLHLIQTHSFSRKSAQLLPHLPSLGHLLYHIRTWLRQLRQVGQLAAMIGHKAC
jgi:hypothetical protein